MIVRECWRFFRSRKLISLTGVILLTIGIGASTITYCLLSAASAHRFPGVRAQGYATIGSGEKNSVLFPVSWQRKVALEDSLQGRLHLAAYSPSEAKVNLTIGNLSQPINVAAVSGKFFSFISGPLLAGQDFSETDATNVVHHEIILGGTLATSLFGSPVLAVGQNVALNGTPYQVSGVAAFEFRGLLGDDAEAWVPAHSIIPLRLSLPSGFGDEESLWKSIDSFYLLAADEHLSSDNVGSAVSHVTSSVPALTSDLVVAPGITFDPERDRTMRNWLSLALGFSQLLAVISCLNVCMLLLARAPLLVSEVKLKQALGATPWRILGELVVGPLTMMSAGVLGAFLLASGLLSAALRTSTLNTQLLRGSLPEVARATLLTLLMSFALVALASLIPAAVVLRASSAPRMGSTTTANRYTIRLLQAQVAAQIGCGIVVAILASMIATAFLSMIRQPLGFEPKNRLVVCVEPARGWLTFSGTSGASAEFLALRRVIHQLGTLGGVRSVSYTQNPPFGETPLSVKMVENPARTTNRLQAQSNLVTSEYFRTMGSRILRGRGLSDWMQSGIDHETVINAQLARQLFAEDDPIGKTLLVQQPEVSGSGPQRYALTVVGVVENTRDAGYGSSPRPALFEEAHAATDAMPHLIVDSDLSGRTLQQTAQIAISSLMREYKVRQLYSLSDKVHDALAPDEYRAEGALICAVAMDAVAFIGLYSALVYFVRTKRREIAIRICLGAPSSAIRRLVILQALKAATAGALLSVPVWLLFQSSLVTERLGAVAWSSSRAILITIAGIATSVLLAMVPAARATSVHPGRVLNEE